MPTVRATLRVEFQRLALCSGRSPQEFLLSQVLSPSRSLSSVVGDLSGPLDVDELLYLICLAAIDAVPGAAYAGITMADRRGGLETRVATHLNRTGSGGGSHPRKDESRGGTDGVQRRIEAAGDPDGADGPPGPGDGDGGDQAGR